MRHKVVELRQTCYACPSSWEGLSSNGDEIYLRYRHGTFRLDINGVTAFSRAVGDSLDGVLSLEEAVEVTKDYLEFPAELVTTIVEAENEFWESCKGMD